MLEKRGRERSPEMESWEEGRKGGIWREGRGKEPTGEELPICMWRKEEGDEGKTGVRTWSPLCTRHQYQAQKRFRVWLLSHLFQTSVKGNGTAGGSQMDYTEGHIDKFFKLCSNNIMVNWMCGRGWSGSREGSGGEN